MTDALHLHAWMIRHHAHGLCLDTLVFLAADDLPETDADWVRVPWLDGDSILEAPALLDEVKTLRARIASMEADLDAVSEQARQAARRKGWDDAP